MRFLRGWLPPIVAGLCWLASAGIELLGRQQLSASARAVLSLVSPETVPILQLTAPGPWGVVMTALSVVALVSACAALLGAVRRAPESRSGAALAFVGYWFCVIAAAVVVAAIPVVVELAGALVTHVTPFSIARDHLVGIAHWGVAWGWIPALLAVALDARPAAPRRRTVLSALAVLLLAGIGLTIAAPAADAARQAQIPAEPTPEPAPTGTPVPEVAPGDWQIDPLWCTSGQLEFSVGGADAAAGHRRIVITATNVSDASCVLDGYPDVAFSEPLGNAIEVGVDHGGTMMGADPGVARIDLAPGAQVVSIVGWGAMSTAGSTGAGWVFVAAYPGAIRQQLQVDTDIVGGRVSVTAWGAPTAP